jgi:hypothetical protein
MIFCSSSYASEIGWDTNRIPFYRIESKSKETALLRIKYNWWQCQHYRIVVDSGSDNRVKTSCSSPLGRGLRGPTEPGVKPIPVPEKAEQKHGPPPSLRWLTKLRFRGGNEREPSSSFVLFVTEAPSDQISTTMTVDETNYHCSVEERSCERKLFDMDLVIETR